MKFWWKIGEWTRRYGMAEITGTLAALGGARLGWAWSHNEAVAAYGGSIAEVIAFWGTMFIGDIRTDARWHAGRGETYGVVGTLRTVRNLLIECGPAELFDTGVIRPLAMGVFAHYLDRDLGIFLGKLVGDVFFYIPAITTYETRQWLRRKSEAARVGAGPA